MSSSSWQKHLLTAVEAAREVGELMKLHRLRRKQVNQTTAHDLKLELDVRSQRKITRHLARNHPEIPVLGEEESDPTHSEAPFRWVVDPIDGTVNFASGIPHACVSIALEKQTDAGAFESVVGVIYDPFNDELWTARKGGPALRNGRRIHPSPVAELSQSMVSLGFAQSEVSLNTSLRYFTILTPKVRKLRIMGSAALAMAYVADGRFDAYLEAGLRRWDIAAGRLILECAGGVADCPPVAGEHAFAVKCHNGRLGPELARTL
jgi:myo-inositol-1(or 4)-monophosphatase